MPSALVIEDDPSLRLSLQRLLQSAGYDVHAAADGAEGVAAFRQQRPDVVVTDIVMPEQEGIETIMLLRSIAPSCPIIAISGGGRIGSADFLQMAERLGATAVLAKPFEPGALLSKVREAIAVASDGSAHEATST